MPDWYGTLLRPLLFRLDPESPHEKAIAALRWAGRHPSVLQRLRKCCEGDDPRLRCSVLGLSFPNPTGLAAGFDKNAVAIPALAALGFGFIEVGTITALAQPGNPKPRMFRLPADQALINRLGFNNEGAEIVAGRLVSTTSRPKHPLGINLGKSKATPIEQATDDYLKSFRLLQPHGDYFVVNVSSPNTPDLRKLQEKDRLDELLGALQSENTRRVPVLVKIAPDLSFEQIDDVLDLIQKHSMAGIIATNTTIQRPGITGPIKEQQGGLSGKPLRAMSNNCVRYIWKKTQIGRAPL